MNLTEYQERAAATVIYPKDKAFEYLLPGLLVEVLEAEETFHSVSDPVYLLKEFGDQAWFVANGFTELGFQLADYRQWANQANNLDSIAVGLAVLKHHARKACDIHVKALRDQHPMDTEDLLFHLSTIFHVLDLIAPLLGTNLEAILQMNVDKLASRQRRGVLSGSGDDR